MYNLLQSLLALLRVQHFQYSIFILVTITNNLILVPIINSSTFREKLGCILYNQPIYTCDCETINVAND